MIKKVLYTVWQWTWGIVQTLLGFGLFIRYRKYRHYNYHGACVTVWNSKSSISLGQFIFLTDDPFFYYESQKATHSFDEFNKGLLVHEYGHTVQSLIFGPFYLFVIGIFSLSWSYLPVFAKMRKNGMSYFDLFCESNANKLGEWVTKEKSIGRP